MGKGIPDGWLYCPKKSNLIANRFVAFKTPLDQKFDTIPESFKFTPKIFLEWMKRTEIKLALWIDLTNTDRYYSSKAVKDAGIEYKKLKLTGHGSPPTDSQIKQFFAIVEDFYKDRRQTLDCVGVHCTHGFNRTGYLIIAFMVEKLGYRVEAALQEFAEQRPPGIYRQSYVDDLHKKYKAQSSAPLVRMPNWASSREREYSTRRSTSRGARRRSRDRDNWRRDRSLSGSGGGGRSHDNRKSKPSTGDKITQEPLLLSWRSNPNSITQEPFYSWRSNSANTEKLEKPVKNTKSINTNPMTAYKNLMPSFGKLVITDD